jgi:chemotaxis protein methyltransferase CheR
MNENEAFLKIKELIHEKSNLDVSQYKENYIKRRLAVRMRALQASNYEEYMKVLEKDSREHEILLDKLTINVTQFFRDPEVFVELENTILPEILSKQEHNLKVWSAGCSTGEEPYSIAISIEETAERLGVKGLSYSVFATDLDQLVLHRAVEGKYEGRTMDNIAETRRKKYFSFDGRFYKVSDRIKQRVSFMKLNLMDHFKKDFFDIVFCRNVIIYFNRELQKTVLNHYYDALKDRGILYLGKTETMLLDLRDKFECINIKERIFRKI